MPGNKSKLLPARIVMAIAAVILLPFAVEAQTARKTKELPRPPRSAVFTEALARAKESSRPLIVFGVAEGCSRCAALKQGLATQPDLKLLMTQYVATAIQFGGPDFVAIWDDAVRQNANAGPAIGAPAVFIFTAKGDAVYAGPNSPSGMPPDDEFKKVLIAGIEKNGGLRGPARPEPSASFAADVAKASKLLSDNQVVAAAAALSKHVSSNEVAGNVTDDAAALANLTGLKLAKSKTEEQFDSLVQQVSKKGLSLIDAAIATSTTGDATRGAVQLAELDRVFRGYPLFEGQFDSAWKELLAKTNVPNLKEQAELIDTARQAETGPDQAQAITAYELVCATYPDTKAAELSQLRMTQLQMSKKAAARIWKSKVGQFSVTATLVAFDGKSAQLQTADGKTITVALDALSTEDQQFLKEAKPQN